MASAVLFHVRLSQLSVHKLTTAAHMVSGLGLSGGDAGLGRLQDAARPVMNGASEREAALLLRSKAVPPSAL